MADVITVLSAKGWSTTVHLVFKEECFRETAEGLRGAFSRAALPAPTVSEITDDDTTLNSFADPGQLHLLLGAHLFPVLPRTYVVWNLEQMSSRWMTPEYAQIMLRAVLVCDYSSNNLTLLGKFLAKHGASPPLAVLPLYVVDPPLAAAAPAPLPPVDVLFYGCSNERRVAMRAMLEAQGLKHVLFLLDDYDVWGDRRAALVHSATVVLNLHYWDNAALEAHRLLPLLVSGACIVSEQSSDDELDWQFQDGVTFADYSRIPRVVHKLVNDSAARAEKQARARALGVRMLANVQPVKDMLAAAAAT